MWYIRTWLYWNVWNLLFLYKASSKIWGAVLYFSLNITHIQLITMKIKQEWLIKAFLRLFSKYNKPVTYTSVVLQVKISYLQVIFYALCRRIKICHLNTIYLTVRTSPILHLLFPSMSIKYFSYLLFHPNTTASIHHWI